MKCAAAYSRSVGLLFGEKINNQERPTMADMIVLPTVISCPMAGMDNPDIRSPTKPVLLRVQLNTETGQVYQLPLSAQAADQLFKLLSNLR